MVSESEGRDRAAIDAALESIAEDARLLLPGAVGEGVAYALAGEGKRLRGLLVLAAYRSCGGTGDATPLAAAVEVVHAYSLVHDDLPCMDDDDLRRGRPTVHRVHGVDVATVVGVAMIPLAARAAWRAVAALGASRERQREVVRRLMEASGAAGMVGGQLLDLEAEGRGAGLDELEAIHRGKTGALIACAAAVGGIAAGASETMVQALEGFGLRVGLAFQIADDVLDVTATSEVLGKTAGRDVALAKSTYPSLLGVEGARQRADQLVSDALALLSRSGIAAPALEGLARFSVHRSS